MTTNTERLQALLDERSVDWKSGDFIEPNAETQWGNNCYTDYQALMPYLTISNCTPEQAIAATLGDSEATAFAERVERAVAKREPLTLFGVDYSATLDGEINGETSDGYHTFNELYHHRAVLFSVIVENYRDAAWKAKKHHDNTMYDGMFIVGIDTPWGQASYHYDLNPYWDMFDCEERETAPEWDGHTPDEAIERIGKLASLGGNGYRQAAAYWKRMFEELLTERIGEECERVKHGTKPDGTPRYRCSVCGYGLGDYRWAYCPKCGCKIRKAVKR